MGVTGNLARRMHEHKKKNIGGFTKKYEVDKLVYAESFQYVQEAIWREKCIKKWNRGWKIRLIESDNPQWKDLTETHLNIF